MSGGMVTITAYAQHGNDVRTATLTCSVAAFERDTDTHVKMAQAWFAEDHPDVPADAVMVEIRRD